MPKLFKGWAENSITRPFQMCKKQLEAQRQNNNAKPQQSTNNCADGHCQRIVSEGELGGLLTQGWRVARAILLRFEKH